MSPPAIAAPSSPSSVSASISGGDDITISWSSVSGATSYEREVNLNGGSWINRKSYTGTSVTFSNQRPGSYRYRVRACNSAGCSGWHNSNTVTVATEVVWSKAVLSIGEPVQVEGLLSTVSYCLSGGATPIRFDNSQQIIFYQTTSGNLSWTCFDSSNQEVQNFSSSLTVDKLSAPVNLGER